MRIVGIDPGLTGALALLHEEGLDVADMPVVDGRVNPYGLTEILVGWGAVDQVVVESQQAYPRQGVSSSFRTGVGYGAVLGVLAVLQRRLVHVTAGKWTNDLRVGSDKDAHRRRAMELFPEHASLFARKKDDGRADAVLIAAHAARMAEVAA